MEQSRTMIYVHDHEHDFDAPHRINSFVINNEEWISLTDICYAIHSNQSSANRCVDMYRSLIGRTVLTPLESNTGHHLIPLDERHLFFAWMSSTFIDSSLRPLWLRTMEVTYDLLHDFRSLKWSVVS